MASVVFLVGGYPIVGQKHVFRFPRIPRSDAGRGFFRLVCFSGESGCEMPRLIVRAAILRRSLRTVGREIPNLDAISATERPSAKLQSTICSRGFRCLANVETRSLKLTASNTSPLV